MHSSFFGKLCFLLTCIVFLYSCKKDDGLNPATPGVISAPPDFGFKVVGYYLGRDPSIIPDEKFRICNVINYAFATINTNGDLIIAQIARLPLVVAKARTNQAKVMISVNSPSSFKTHTSTAVQRNMLIKGIMK